MNEWGGLTFGTGAVEKWESDNAEFDFSMTSEMTSELLPSSSGGVVCSVDRRYSAVACVAVC